MTEFLFNILGLLSLPLWALMILAPRWKPTVRVVGSPWIVVPILAVYLAVVLPALGDVMPTVTSPTLDGVRVLLGTPAGATAAWAHMMAFDLFVGRWIWLDAGQRRIPALVTSPLLVLTIVLGPAGLAAYLLVRLRWRVPAAVGVDALG